jgi:Zn-dependent protease
VNRGDPQSGIFLVLLLLLALQVLNGGNIPPAEVVFFFLLAFVVATTIHEFMHAYSAFLLGDTTARDLGRITLNPVAHFDPFGFFGMVMISLGFNFIGWGKPVPVNLNRVRPVLGQGIVGRRRAFALIALAGPVSNVVQAAIASGVFHLMGYNIRDFGAIVGAYRYQGYPAVASFLAFYFYVNILLAAFNLIPVPPLDGSKILLGILPNFWYPIFAPLERYGFMILFLLFYLGSRIGGHSITGEMINPTLDLLTRIFF